MILTAFLSLAISLVPQQPDPTVLARILTCDANRSSSAQVSPIASNFREAPGPIHGADPHDEIHDSGLPANREAGTGYPSSDPYNDSTSNNRDYPNRPY